MRTSLIAANWKMNTTVGEATELVHNMLGALDEIGNIEKVVCPPFISLVTVAEMLRGSSIKLGVQNMYFEDRGAYTGEISPSMLAGLCQFAIIGHSERRQYFNETGEIINKKVKAALGAGITPILCIGEKLEDNEAGKTAEVVSRQLDSALTGMDSLGGTVIAYEPVWAIGSGKSATGERASETIALIREKVASLYDIETARNMRILYGGSVTADNIAEFVNQPQIDGALVGGASLKAEQFISIVRQTAEIRGS
ncbi:MAG: triose-phosphate isomerase [Dehalococcoidales bacterium]|nr:triose-phosphate isomerase [Dehalococcoidales bacterium]